MKARPGPRALAATLLERLNARHVPLDVLLQEHRDALPARDRALLQELCFGVCRWQGFLDGLLRQMVHKPFRDRDRVLHYLLLVGVYQMHFLRVPDHAAVSSTVAASAELGKAWAKGMINGVLRRFQREQQQLVDGLDETARSSHPAWLLQAIQQDWPDQAAEIVEANNARPPMTLRVRGDTASREAYLEELATAGIEASAGRWSSSAVQLAQPCDPAGLPGFNEGRVSVQDEGAQLAAQLLAPTPGSRVLDACAAPGGKTCHLLELAGDLELLALDNDADRLDRVADNLRRCGLQAGLCCADAGDPGAWWNGRAFDAILADLPCSATGVIRRHPDIKALRQTDQIVELHSQQQRLLAALWSCLRPGGRLLYSTCSILAAENDATIEALVSRCNDVEVQTLPIDCGLTTRFGRQLLPQADSHDGFYYALLRKSG